MKIDSKKILEIDTSNAQVTINDLKKAVSEYRKELGECVVGSKEAEEATNKLNKAQTALNAAQKGAIDTLGYLDDSYNGLSNQMRKLKDEQKQIDISTEEGAKRFDEYAKKIFEINDKLKECDEKNGIFARNVGNYTKSMVDAFGQVGLSIGNISPLFANLADGMVKSSSKGVTGLGVLKAGIQGLGAALKGLAANPVGAVIMAIVLAVKAAKATFDAFKKSVEGNEVASNNMAKALAPFKAIIQGIKNVFDNLVESITAGLAFFGKITSAVMQFIGVAGDMVGLENQIADLEASNAEEHRKILVENSKLELDASEARAKAADKENYTAQERLKFAQEYADKQKEIAANNLKEAENELKLLEAQAATGKNNKEMNDKLAEAQAKLNQVQSQYNQTLRQTNTELHRLNEEIDKEAEEVARKAEEAHKKAAEAAKKHAEEVAKAKQAYQGVKDTLREFTNTDMQNDIDAINKKWDEQTKILKENARLSNQYKNLQNDLLAIENARSEELSNNALKYGKILEEANNKFYDLYLTDADNKIISEQRKLQAQRNAYKETIEMFVKSGKFSKEELEANLKDWDEYIQKQLEKTKQELADADLKKEVEELLTPTEDFHETLKKSILQSLESGDIDIEVARVALEKLGFDAETINQLLLDLANEIQWGVMVSGITASLDELSAFASEIASIGEGISSEWANVFSTLSEGVAVVAQDLKEGKKGWQTWGQAAAMACQVASNTLMALADEQDTQTKEGFEANKKLQVGAATMSMMAGIVSAMVNSIRDLGMPWGAVIGAAMSSMIAAMGGVQIAKISQMQFGGNGGANTSIPSVNMASLAGVSNPTTYTQDINGANIEESIKDTKVYVVESDIQSASKKVSVAQNESRF